MSAVEPYAGSAAPPAMASVETTMYCNLQCPMCLQYQNGTTVSGPHMEPDVFLQVAGALFPLVDRVQFSVSGEPLMSKRLDRLVGVAAEHGVAVEYYTNGTLLDERMLARILPTLGRLNVSFDGATKATFESVRAGADFEQVVEHVRAAAGPCAPCRPTAARPSASRARSSSGTCASCWRSWSWRTSSGSTSCRPRTWCRSRARCSRSRSPTTWTWRPGASARRRAARRSSGCRSRCRAWAT